MEVLRHASSQALSPLEALINYENTRHGTILLLTYIVERLIQSKPTEGEDYREREGERKRDFHPVSQPANERAKRDTEEKCRDDN